MAHDDLGSWLKAAAENKITTKNTWKSTLIDHFANVDEFRESQGINFQKASCTLDGCVKVYSTRVDDVSENAMRLLEGFSEDAAKKKQAKRQAKSTIEKNPSNLNIRTGEGRLPLNPRISRLASLSENALLVGRLDVSPDGVFRMSCAEAEESVVMANVELSVSLPEGLLISPSVTECREMEDIAMEPVAEDEALSQDESVEFGSFGFDDIPVASEMPKPVFRENAFTYFKGWAGPSHWRIRSKRSAGGASRARERFFMDFREPVDHEGIMALGNTLFEQSFILKRRETQYILPQDFRLEIDDLYRYMVRNGHFGLGSEEIQDISIPPQISSFVVEEPADEFVMDVPAQEAQGRMLLPFRKTAKRVDVKRLKENIFSSLKTGHTDLASIYQSLPRAYSEEESREISIHFCIVSLLHLANERNVQLSNTGSNIEISLPG